MKKLIITMLALALLLTGSGCSAAAPKSNRDWINTDVNGALSADMNARLQDDFNLAYNRDYILSLTIPDGMKQAGGLYDAMLESEQRLLDTVTDDTLDGHDATLVHDYYRMLMDWDSRNGTANEKAAAYLEEIRSLKNLNEMTEYLKNSVISAINGGLITYYSTPSFADSSVNMLEVSSVELSLVTKTTQTHT